MWSKKSFVGFLLLSALSVPCFSQSFEEKLAQALVPLKTLPELQKKQLTQVLTIFADEFDLRAKASEETQKQLDELSTTLINERSAHALELQSVKDEAFKVSVEVGVVSFSIGVLTGGVIWMMIK